MEEEARPARSLRSMRMNWIVWNSSGVRETGSDESKEVSGSMNSSSVVVVDDGCSEDMLWKKRGRDGAGL